MLRARTVRKTTKKTTPLSLDTSPMTQINVETVVEPKIEVPVVEPKKEYSTESMLSALHDAETRKAVQRPWLRLERGIRMKLLRAYTEKKTELSVSEKAEMLQVLVDALDKRALNSKSQITYSAETGEISEINSLKISKNPAGKVIFKIDSSTKTTKKAKRQNGSDDD
jgi:hypothetical protein